MVNHGVIAPDASELLTRLKTLSLDGIRARLPPIQPITKNALLTRLDELRCLYVDRQPLTTEEFIVDHNEIVIDTIAFYGKRPVPFSARSTMQLVVVPDQPSLKKFLGRKIGERFVCKERLTDDYPAVDFRAKVVEVQIIIKNANKLTIPLPDDLKFLAKLKLGNSLEEMMSNLVKNMIDEQKLAYITQIRQQAISELASTQIDSIATSLIDSEIENIWTSREKPILQAFAISEKQQRELCQTWVNHDALRATIHKQLAEAQVIDTLIQEGIVKLNKQDFDAFLEQLESACGIKPTTLKSAITAEPEAAKPLLETIAKLIIDDKLLDVIFATQARAMP